MNHQKPIIVAVSGGFDPLHVGHVRLMQEAKKLGDRLIVIINNDNWLQTKKGYTFMTENDRLEIIQALACVDEAILTDHQPDDPDPSVCKSLEKIKPNIFANGGDRKHDNIPEYQLCEESNIKMFFNIGKGGKVRSSSELVQKAEQTK
jgi:cytidyltransferase-like protein